METRINVVEFSGQKMFKCAKVKFNGRLVAYAFGGQMGPVRFYRSGELCDQGRVGLIKLCPDSAQETLMFLDFANESLNSGLEYFSNFKVNNLELGDELVLDFIGEQEFLRMTVENFLTLGWNPYRVPLRREFPYPANWREDRDAARAIWEQKVARVYEELANGKLAFLNFQPRKLEREKQPTQFVIEVRQFEGRNYLFFQGIYFNALPLIQLFWEADYLGGSEIAICRDGCEEPPLCSIYAHEVGTHGATLMFNSYNQIALPFLGGYPYATVLSAKNFLVGDKLVVKSPIAFDLVEALAEYVGSDTISALAPLVALWPESTSALDLFPATDYHLGEDMNVDFCWRIHDRKVELVKTGQVTVLEFRESK